MTTTHIVHYNGATAKSQSVIASLAKDSVENGEVVTIIDIGRTTTITQGFPANRWAKLLGHTVFENALQNILDPLGVAIVPLPNATKRAAVTPEHRDALEQALESELLTYFRLDHIPKSAEARNLSGRLRSAMMETYAALTELWSHTPPDRVLIPNGRTSRQKAARLVAETMGLNVFLYENGRASPDSYYLGRTQPHDRVASQQEILDGFPLPQGRALETVADTWLTHRMAGSAGTNQFSDQWAPASALSQKNAKRNPTAVFFASSFDEFLAFGPMWTIDEWSHQFEAFDLMMSILEDRGVELVLRLHPNLGTKSRQYFLREVRDILALQDRHPSLKIHWHNEPTNSYDLVRNADYVIVERSTIGLEASLMGKPVWVTQAAQWDMVADVRQVLRPTDISEEVLELWDASPLGAQKFVAYWMAQEKPLHYNWQTWASWDPEKAPLRMKVAQLTVDNSWRHKKRLLLLEWAKWRNSRFTPRGRKSENK